MLKDFKVLNKSFDVKSYDKIFNQFEEEFKSYGSDLEKYSKCVTINKKEIPVGLLRIKDKNYINVFLEFDNVNVVLSFNANRGVYFSHSMSIYQNKVDDMYDIKSIILTKNDSEMTLEIDFNNHKKISSIEYEYEKVVNIKLRKKATEEKYKDESITVINGLTSRTVVIKNRRLDYDEMIKSTSEFIIDRDSDKLDLYRTKLNENSFDKRFLKSDFESEQKLVSQELSFFQNSKFMNKALNLIFGESTKDDFLSIDNYSYKSNEFFNKKDPRISIKVEHYIGSSDKIKIKLKDKNTVYDIERNNIHVIRLYRDIASYKELHFTKYCKSEINENIHYVTSLRYPIESDTIFKRFGKGSNAEYNALINRIINKFKLEPAILRDVAYPSEKIKEMLDVLSLEDDNTDIEDLKKPFELLKKSIEIIEKENITIKKLKSLKC